MFWCNEVFYKEFKCFNSVPTLETSNYVSFDNFEIDKNSPGFLLKYLRLNYAKNSQNFNINSTRNKFDLLKKLVTKERYTLMITETKLVDSFPAFQFLIQGFCVSTWRSGVVVITTTQLHSTKPEPRFRAGSSPARGVSEIRDGEDLWEWSQLEIKLNAFRQLIIPQKQFIIIICTSFRLNWNKNGGRILCIKMVVEFFWISKAIQHQYNYINT